MSARSHHPLVLHRLTWLLCLGPVALLALALVAWPSLGADALAQVPEPPQDVSRPDPEGGPTEVQLFLGVIDLVEVKEVSQSFMADTYSLASWIDPRLAHPGPGNVTRPLSSVWTPRLQVLNRRRVFSALPSIVEITPDGRVTFQQRFWGEYSAPLELEDYPFDRQHFEVRVMAAGYTPDEVKLVPYPEVESGLNSTLSVPNWTILSVDTEQSTYRVFEGSRGSATYALVFEAQRRRGHHLLKYILPLVVIVMMSWTVFWIDPTNTGPQISAATTTMLTLIAYRFMIGGRLPNISYLTRMDVFILGATILVFLTLGEAVITARLAISDQVELARRMDRVGRWLSPLAMAVLVVFSFWG